MNEAGLVRDSVMAMRDAIGNSLPVTVKHRIGIDRSESYEFMRDFVGTVAEGGCTVFIVHARNAWLKGLSPKDNREIPPLRYELVHRLKREFPHLTIVINGGFTRSAEIAEQLSVLDGVMVGRQAYHQPAFMAAWDAGFLASSVPAAVAGGGSGLGDPGDLGDPASLAGSIDPGDEWRAQVEDGMVAYLSGLGSVPWSHASRHMLGLWNGRPGARRWRQVWSDHSLKPMAPAEVQRRATAARLHGAATSEPVGVVRGVVRHDPALAHNP